MLKYYCLWGFIGLIPLSLSVVAGNVLFSVQNDGDRANPSYVSGIEKIDLTHRYSLRYFQQYYMGYEFATEEDRTNWINRVYQIEDVYGGYYDQ